MRFHLVLSTLVLSLTCWTAQAQFIDEEPNGTCEGAQDLGIVALPATIDGRVSNGGSDVFTLILEPDVSAVRVRGGSNFSLSAYDSECELIADSYFADLSVAVPEDGVLAIGIRHEFSGRAYTLSVEKRSATGPISGRVVDSFRDFALSDSYLELYRCLDRDCDSLSYVADFRTDEDGRFSFEYDYDGPLAPGRYLIDAQADTYNAGHFGPFDALEGDALDVGDLGLRPFAIRVFDVAPCANLPAFGGNCRLSFKVENRTPSMFRGYFWGEIGVTQPDGGGFSRFQVSNRGAMSPTPQELELAGFGTKTVRLQFFVPRTVATSTRFCANVTVAEGVSVHRAVFAPVEATRLFCVRKLPSDGFSVTVGNEE